MSSRYEELLREVKAKLPGFEVVKRGRTNWAWRLVWWFLSILTPGYKDRYATTIGLTMFVPDTWDDPVVWSDEKKWCLLRHEAVHAEQSRTWPFGARAGRLNAPFWGLAYLLLLPAIFTLRAKFEREAFVETLIAEAELGWLNRDQHVVRARVDRLVQIFSSRAYFFMWRSWPAEKWAVRTIFLVLDGKLASRWAS